MPLTIGCPNCPTKLKVPDNAGGRRVKCPKCGGVMTVPSGTEPPPHTPEPLLTPPPPAKTHDSPPPVRARRRDDDAPAEKAARPIRRRDEDDRPDPTDDAGRLHKGWKSVALGYRMLGLAMLFLLAGVPFTVLAYLVGGMSVAMSQTGPSRQSNADAAAMTAATIGGGLVVVLVWVFVLLAFISFLKMPREEEGGKGKTVATVSFVLWLIPGLQWVATLILLPLFSGGVGTALNKPRLRKYGLGLFVWYAVGFILQPLLAGGAWFGLVAVLGPSGNGPTLAALVAGVIALILGLLVFFSVWGTFVGLRRGIQASIRERGIIGGQDPKLADEPKRKRRDRDREEEDDRPQRRQENVADDDDPDDALSPPPKRATRTEGDPDDRPKKRKRDEDDEDDRPRKRR